MRLCVKTPAESTSSKAYIAPDGHQNFDGTPPFSRNSLSITVSIRPFRWILGKFYPRYQCCHRIADFVAVQSLTLDLMLKLVLEANSAEFPIVETPILCYIKDVMLLNN